MPLPLLVLLLLASPAPPSPSPGWGWPLGGAPVVDRPFTPPRTSYGAGHRGVDLRAPVGASVRAAGAGTVTYVGLLAGRGVVTVSHPGGLRTTYEPVAASVPLGQVVGLGTRIGAVTRGHASCRPGTTCLHWGLLRGSVYLDPLSLLSRTPVRLLPLGSTPVQSTAGARSPRAPIRVAGRPGPAVVAARAAQAPPGQGVSPAAVALVLAGSVGAAGAVALWARRR